MRTFLNIIVLILVQAVCRGQVGIGTPTPNANAVLDITSATKGLLQPRVALTGTSSAAPLSAHVAGMILYNTATAGTGATAVTPGFYLNNGSGWQRLAIAPGNSAPVALNPTVSGSGIIGQVLSASFTYVDADGDAQGATTYQWYWATDIAGSNLTPISGATASTYTPNTNDNGKFILAGITPVAATGTGPGLTVYAAGSTGPAFKCGVSAVTFVYNGASVTYGTIASPTSGACYLDRNLGALQVATSSTDFKGYGDMFQWGRLADGHQLYNWSGTSIGTGVNGTTTTLSTGDVPANGLFILGSSAPYDWRVSPNNNLWLGQGVGGNNNPCPQGWYVPSIGDWGGETGITSAATAYSQLKLPVAGWRDASNGIPTNAGITGEYWSSSPSGTSGAALGFGTSPLPFNFRGAGMPVRCRRS